MTLKPLGRPAGPPRSTAIHCSGMVTHTVSGISYQRSLALYFALICTFLAMPFCILPMRTVFNDFGAELGKHALCILHATPRRLRQPSLRVCPGEATVLNEVFKTM